VQRRVEEIRKLVSLRVNRPTVTDVRWYVADLEDAMRAADMGFLAPASKLWRATRSDGIVAGLLSTCTDGLVRLPKSFSGDDEQVEALRGTYATSVFDAMFPPSELALLAADGRGLGVGVAELVPVEGRDYPVMVRQDPEWLRYRWDQNQWYFLSNEGELPITPGDGRWILHVPGGRVSPWQHGLWYALGDAWIAKTHAKAYRSNWESKLANPARVAVSPQGASEEQSQSWFKDVMAWGVNSVFGVKPGYDVKLLESNGRGYEAFGETIKTSNEEIIISLAGQLVTTTGGTGFANADIHKSIRADIIKAIADSLAHTINTQGLPAWIVERWGIDALANRACVSWDVAPPTDRNSEGKALVSLAEGIQSMRDALVPYGRDVDIDALLAMHGIPTVAATNITQGKDVQLPVSIYPLVLTGNEARKIARVEPKLLPDGTPDPVFELTVHEMQKRSDASAEIAVEEATTEGTEGDMEDVA